MKTIVIPTDFSENAWKAASYAVALFGSEPCKYILLNTYSVPMANSLVDVDDFYKELQGDSMDELKKLEVEFKDLNIHPESEVVLKCELGYLVPELIQMEEKEKIDFIVLGTRGTSGPGEYFFGTNAAETIAKCSSPVICVPDTAKLELTKEILFAIDANGIKYISTIQPVVELCKKFNSKVHFGYVSQELTDQDKEVQELDKYVIDNFYNNLDYTYEHIKGVMVEDELLKYARMNNMDLLVMIKHDRGFWGNTFHKSLTKTTAFHTDIPLLVLHDKA